MLNLIRLIRKRWSTSARLAQLVPPERLFTGTAREPVEVPYAVLSVGQRELQQATSSGTQLVRTAIEFRLWAHDLDTLDRLATGIRATFHRIDSNLEEGDTLLDMQFSSSSDVERVDETWHVTLNYSALIQSTTTVAT